LVLDAFEATGCADRHRLEHAMILSDEQIERVQKLNPFVTFQPEFLMRFGHAYRLQLGEDRTAKLKRSRSVLDAGIRLSYNSDRPIVPGDPLDGIRTAVHRPDGFDAGENVTLAEAVRAYTVAGAAVCGDETLGSLGAGEPADYQLMSPSSWSALL
jgi:predicted amidohydrolase YtcJ